jgi:hypothetical protein
MDQEGVSIRIAASQEVRRAQYRLFVLTLETCCSQAWREWFGEEDPIGDLANPANSYNNKKLDEPISSPSGPPVLHIPPSDLPVQELDRGRSSPPYHLPYSPPHRAVLPEQMAVTSVLPAQLLHQSCPPHQTLPPSVLLQRAVKPSCSLFVGCGGSSLLCLHAIRALRIHPIHPTHPTHPTLRIHTRLLSQTTALPARRTGMGKDRESNSLQQVPFLLLLLCSPY